MRNLLRHISATVWDLDEATLEQLWAIVVRHDAGVKLDAAEVRSAIGRAPRTPNPRDRQYDLHQGVAIIPVQGVIHKHAAQVQDLSGPSGTSYEQILADVRMAMADPTVTAALLHVESPGGMSDGNTATSRAMTAAAQAAGKPLWTLIDGLGASAGYGMSIAGSRVYATPSSQVGSIGTIMALRDTSAAVEKTGVKMRVVRSAPQKGGPAAGEPITDAHLADAQRIVNAFAQQFYDLVSERRGLTGEDLVAAVDQGRVQMAAAGVALGLIDGVASLEQVLAMLTDPSQRTAPLPTRAQARVSTTPSPAPGRNQEPRMKIDPQELSALVKDRPAHAAVIVAMAAGSADKAPATKDEILAHLQVLEHQATAQALTDAKAALAKVEGELASAKTAHDAALAKATTDHAAALAAKDAQIAKLTADLAEAVALAGTKGTKAIDGKPIATPLAGDPIAAYEAKSAELKKAGDKTPARTIATKFPELNSAYVAATNDKTQKGASK